MAATVKSVLIDETVSLVSSSADVVRSGAYIYPFKGIFYIGTHKPLWGPPLSKAWPTASLGMGVTTAMFFFTYLPHTAILSITSGPLLGPISAAFMVLTESSTITNYLARRYIIGDALLDVFDGTLVACGEEGLVSEGRQLEGGSKKKSGGGGGGDGERDPMSRLGAIVKRPLESAREITPQSVIKSLLYLPLNFVPVIGTLLYVFVQGKKVGPLLHERYFQLKRWDSEHAPGERKAWVEKRRAAYTGLGMASFVLEMIPFVSIAFSFSNAVGAALWAADIEKAIR